MEIDSEPLRGLCDFVLSFSTEVKTIYYSH